ncbi:MAG: IclR family transcriptional regulator [Desulfomonile tiedjei]|nr:IclR family transcriptional regulator [Desulfomonile tiedjei]
MTDKKTSINVAYSAPIVSKAMRVLKMIATAPKNPGISEIALALSLAKSTTHGILAALEESGWVLRDPVTRKYTCGYTAKHIGSVATVRVPLVDQARPHLEKLAEELDEDVFLGILTGNSILILDQVESSKELKVTARPGTRIPMYAGAVGKMFLAYQDRETVGHLLRTNPLPRFTARSVTDPVQYVRELDQVQEAGVAVDREEYIPNMLAVAVPIFYGKKNRKRMVAGFWIVGLDWHLNPEKMKKATRLAVRTGEAVSQAISKQLNW